MRVNKTKRRRRAGFSLAETLIVVLILLIVSAIVGAAIPSAANVFAKTVDSANAQVLLSTTMTVLRDEFSTIKTVYPGNSATEIVYENGKGHRRLVVASAAIADDGISGPGVWVLNTESEDAEFTPLVSAKAATSEMYVTFTMDTDLTEGVVNISDIQVHKDSHILSEQEDFAIRIIGNADVPEVIEISGGS